MSDSEVSVGILTVAAARGNFVLGGQLFLGFQPERNTVSGGLSRYLPSPVGVKPDGVR